MVSIAGAIIISIVVLLVAAVGGWIGFTQVRARKLGLPPPSFASYLPWHKEEHTYGPPRPAPGGVVGWFNDQVRKFKNRNNRSAAGAYEPSYRGAAAAGGTGNRALDPDEAWDARVGHEADGYGYYGEELHDRGTEYTGGSYNMNLAATPGPEPHSQDHDLEAARGRQQTRTPAKKNPFDDENAADSLRGVSPRPMDSGNIEAAPRPSSDRRSIFKESV